MSSRLTVRFSATYQRWIAALGGDQAEAVRALMTIGAAVLELPDAAFEAGGLLRADLPPDVRSVLLSLADKRQTSGRQAADTPREPPPPDEELPDDPFLAAGIEV